MRLPATLAFSLIGALLLASSGYAQVWQAQTIRVTTAPFQTTQEVTFHFHNDREQPLAILAVQTNCDCLTATSDQTIYAPGARGEIRARFTVGERTGLHERKLTVLTDVSETPVPLVVQIVVPALATVDPQSLAWTAGEPPVEKTIDLRAIESLEINFSVIEITNDHFTARLESIAPGRHYRLHVAPREAGRPANAAIRIRGVEKSGRPVEVSAYANLL